MTDEQALKKLNDIIQIGDTEIGFTEAQKLIVKILQDQGFVKTAQLYKTAMKNYWRS